MKMTSLIINDLRGCFQGNVRAPLALLVAFLALAAAAVRAEFSPAAFEAANRLYEESKYAEAAAAYEKLVAAGPAAPALYFNLGNALFKSSEIGRAIAAYRQAQRLAPRDPDVRANLQFARNQVQGPSLRPTAGQRWLARLSLDEWTLLASSALWLVFLLLTSLQWRPALKPSLRTPVIAAVVAAGLLGSGLVAALYQARAGQLTIVVKPEAVVRLTPIDEAKEAFTVHDGAELRVLDQEGKWLQVSAGPLRLGWLPRDQVLLGSQN